MPPSEIRKEAREALKGKWGKSICILLAYFVLAFILGLVQGFFSTNKYIYLLIELAVLVLSMPLSFGLIISFMKLKRGESVKAFGFLKDGFSRFVKSWGIAWHIFLKMILPIICLFLVAVLISVLVIFNAATDTNLWVTILGVLLYIVTLVYIVSRSLLYAIAYEISYDNPELSSKACVLKSEALMKGNRGSYFLLQLYFVCLVIVVYLAFITLSVLISSSIIGVLISTISMILIVLGIVFYITPYMQVAVVCFYERIAKPEVKTIEEEVKIEE